MNEERKAFIQERNEIIFSLDKERILAYFARTGQPWDENEDEIVFWATIHKIICNITDAPDELVTKSKNWLYDHGMSEKLGCVCI